MSRNWLITGAAAIAVSAGLAVLAAQHRAPAPEAHHPAAMDVLHSMCGSGGHEGQPARAHVPEHFAKALELTAQQSAEIERLATDACAAMARVHESMLAVLTPEQRAKVRELHGSGHDGGTFVDWLKKLHGAK